VRQQKQIQSASEVGELALRVLRGLKGAVLTLRTFPCEAFGRQVGEQHAHPLEYGLHREQQHQRIHEHGEHSHRLQKVELEALHPGEQAPQHIRIQ